MPEMLRADHLGLRAAENGNITAVTMTNHARRDQKVIRRRDEEAV